MQQKNFKRQRLLEISLCLLKLTTPNKKHLYPLSKKNCGDKKKNSLLF